MIRIAHDEHLTIEQVVRVAEGAPAAAGIEPLRAEMKEGLALNNGLQFSTARGVLGLSRLRMLLETAAVTTVVSAQVQLGSDTPYSAELHDLRPHPGGVAVARWLRRLMRGSPIRSAHERHSVDWEVQDPYSLRCAAQFSAHATTCWRTRGKRWTPRSTASRTTR